MNSHGEGKDRAHAVCLLLLVLDRGTVQKVIVLPRDDLLTEELVLEEVEVFRVSPWLLVLTAPSLHK